MCVQQSPLISVDFVFALCEASTRRGRCTNSTLIVNMASTKAMNKGPAMTSEPKKMQVLVLGMSRTGIDFFRLHSYVTLNKTQERCVSVAHMCFFNADSNMQISY